MKRLLPAFILLVFLVLSQSLSWGAIAFDAASNGTTALTGSSMTWNHTVTGSNPVIVVETACVCLDISIISTVTYNGTNLKKIAEIRDGGGSELFSDIWILAGPTTGTHAVTITFSGSLTSEIINGSGSSFTGVHQSYSYRFPYVVHSGNSIGLTDSVSCANAVSGDYVVGVGVDHQGTITADGTQTAIFTQNGFGVATNTSWGSGYIAAATRNSLIWTQGTSDVFSAACVALRPDTETPTVPILDHFGQNANGTSVSSLTLPNYVMGSGTNPLLFVVLSYWTGTGNNTISSVTFGGVSMTRLDSQRVAYAGQIAGVEFWYLKNPSASTANIVATASGTLTDFTMAADSWFLVDQASTFGTVAKVDGTAGAVPSVTVSSQAGGVVHDGMWRDSGDKPTGDFKPTGGEMWNFVNGADAAGNTAQVKNGAASVTMNWTLASGTPSHLIMGVGINFGASVAATPHGLLLMGVGQ